MYKSFWFYYSDSGFEVSVIRHTWIFLCAACFPSEPWNWVSFFPQPTVMNLPASKQMVVIKTFLKILFSFRQKTTCGDTRPSPKSSWWIPISVIGSKSLVIIIIVSWPEKKENFAAYIRLCSMLYWKMFHLAALKNIWEFLHYQRPPPNINSVNICIINWYKIWFCVLTSSENNKLFIGAPAHRGQTSVHTANTFQLWNINTCLMNPQWQKTPSFSS